MWEEGGSGSDDVSAAFAGEFGAVEPVEGEAMRMSLKDKLAWLELHQPQNVSAINVVRVKLGMKPVAGSGRRGGFVIEPWRNWSQRGRSSN